MRSQRQTHWGAVAFTALAGIAIFASIGPAMAHFRGGAGGGAHLAEARPTAEASAPSAPRRDAPAPLRAELGATFLRQSAPPVIYVGQVTTIAMLFRNTGTVAWVKGTPAEARLGILGDDRGFFDRGMAVDWPYPTRPGVQEEAVVEPGGTAQFAFRVRGTEPGRYRVKVAPVVDGVAWMGEGTTLEVIVR